MKILTISHLFKNDERYYTNHANGLFLEQLAGVSERVFVCAIIEQKTIENFHNNYELRDNIEIIELGRHTGLRGFFSISQAFALVKAIRKVDYIYLISGTMAVKAYLLSKLTSTRQFSVYERGYWLDDEYIKHAFRGVTQLLLPIYRPAMGWLRRSMLQDSHIVFTHGDVLYQECLNIKGSSVEAVVPILALKLEDFYLRDDTCQNQSIQLLYVGGVGGKKGVEYLFDAFAKLCVNRRDFLLRMVTKVNLLPHQEEMLDKLAIRNMVQVEVGKPWGDLLKVYREADILIVPSLSEGFPRVLYEGMSQCIPIVTTGVGGIPGVMQSRYNAIVVEAYSIDGIVDGVRSIVNDGVLRRILIKNGLETVKRIFGTTCRFGSHARQVKFHAEQAVASSILTPLRSRQGL